VIVVAPSLANRPTASPNSFQIIVAVLVLLHPLAHTALGSATVSLAAVSVELSGVFVRLAHAAPLQLLALLSATGHWCVKLASDASFGAAGTR
jgi:hypothetical protein